MDYIIDAKFLLIAVSAGILMFYFSYRRRSIRSSSFIALFVSYIFIVLFYTLIGRQNTGVYKYDFVPFDSYVKSLNGYGNGTHIILNYILFVPFGYLLRRFIGKKNTIKYGFMFTLIIEFSQLLSTRGFFEVDDIIGNTLGTIIGCIAYGYVRHWRKANGYVSYSSHHRYNSI